MCSTIVNKKRWFGNSLELHYKTLSMFCSVLFRNWVLHHHVLIVTNSNVLGMLATRNLNNWVIHELLLVNLAKTQYTRDDEG